MSRLYLVLAFAVFCAARVFANDAPEKKSTAELRPMPLSALMERLAKSPLDKGDSQMLRAVAELVEKEEAVANAKNYSPLPGEPKPARIWFRLRNSPVIDVVKSIQDSIKNDRIGDSERELAEWKHAAIVCEPASNSILISATPRVAESAAKLLGKLDARPAMITFTVCIGDVKVPSRDDKASPAQVSAKLPTMQEDGTAWLAEIIKQRRVEILERPQLTTLDGQPANVQIGQRIPIAPNGTYVNVGDILSLTPSLLPNGRIETKLDFEHSQIDPTAPALVIKKSGIQMTFTAKEGQTVIIRVTGDREMFVALTPRIYRLRDGDSNATNSPAVSAKPLRQ